MSGHGNEPLDLIARQDGETTSLESPEVGWFSCSAAEGEVLVAGQECGRIQQLGRSLRLRVPDGVSGIVTSSAPTARQSPVSVGTVLYVLTAWSGAGGSATGGAEAARTEEGLVLRAPQAGRFYLRPAPGEPAFVEPGTELSPGTPVGLLEVMKTFNHVHYGAEKGLPERARVEAVLIEDGAEVLEGDPILRLAPAS